MSVLGRFFAKQRHNTTRVIFERFTQIGPTKERMSHMRSLFLLTML